MINDDDDNNDTRRSDDTDSENNNNYFYELYGAPILLYRNRETYTIQDEDSTIWNYQKNGTISSTTKTTTTTENEDVDDEDDITQQQNKTKGTVTTTITKPTSLYTIVTHSGYIFCNYQNMLYRLQSRWYYPIDYHLIMKLLYHQNVTLPKSIHKLCYKWSKQQQQQQQQEEQNSTIRNKTNNNNNTIPSNYGQDNIYESSIDNNEAIGYDDDDDNNDDNFDIASYENQNSLNDDNNNNNNNESRIIQDDQEYKNMMDELSKLNQRRQQQHQEQEEQKSNDIHSKNEDKTTNNDDDDTDHHNDSLSESYNTNANTTTTTNATTKATTVVGPHLLPSIRERNRAVKQMFQSNAYNTNQLFYLQLHARSFLLLSDYYKNQNSNNNKNNCKNKNSEKQKLLQEQEHHIRQILQAYTQLDTNYIPGKDKLKFDFQYTIHKNKSKRTDGNDNDDIDDNNNTSTRKTVIKRTNHKQKLGISRLLQKQTEVYDRERMNRSLPEYMAPFHLPTVRLAIAHDLQSRNIISISKSTTSLSAAKEIPAIPRDDPNRPSLFGNCLISFPCQCEVCRSCSIQTNSSNNNTTINQLSTPSICLIHPVGPLQDRLRLSFVQLPYGQNIAGHTEPRKSIPEEINIHDRVRQVELCGIEPYIVIVRTDLHCAVFSITFLCPRRDVPIQLYECWGTANLNLLHRIDFRTLWRSIPSYRPIDLTCHPKYGINHTTPCKAGIVYESSHGSKNGLYHFQITSESYTAQKYNISNLQEIIEIDFANHNPMILYCIGRSFVRPTLTTSYIQTKRPRIGHGYALYSIDLRCAVNQSDTRTATSLLATYEWSPNMEEYTSEGIYSISGLHTDWTIHHRLWVSSISAGKTYVIDTRTPCQCLYSFSLPYLCDQPGSILPSTSLYGAGTIFSQPYNIQNYHVQKTPSSSSPITSKNPTGPMFNVSRTPGAIGIHMYNTPLHRPSFQTQSIECMTGPNPTKLGKNLSLSKSFIVPSPDVSDKIFVCGLSTIQMPIQSICNATSHFSDLGMREHDIKDAICSFSITNKGDIYVHVLLQSIADQKYGKSFDNLPLGYSAIPVSLQETNHLLRRQWNVLPFILSNTFPTPGHTIRPLPTNNDENLTSTIDLSSIIEKENQKKKRQSRKRHKPNENVENVTSTSWLDTNTEEDETRIDIPTSDLPHRVLVSNDFDTTNKSMNTLTLPLSLMPPTDQQIEHFLHVRRSDVDSNYVDRNKIWRSDLTPDVLDDAWDENSM